MKGRSFSWGGRKESETDGWKAAIMVHAIKENHVIHWQSAQAVEKEADWGKRGIRGVITIRKFEQHEYS